MPGGRTIFVCKDVQFWRLASVYVGSCDARRVIFPNMNQESYNVMGHDVKIQDDVTSGTLLFVNPAWYHFYLREGINFTEDDSGETLRLTNAVLIVGTARVGGQPMLANSVVKQTDGPQTGPT